MCCVLKACLNDKKERWEFHFFFLRCAIHMFNTCVWLHWQIEWCESENFMYLILSTLFSPSLSTLCMQFNLNKSKLKSRSTTINCNRSGYFSSSLDLSSVCDCCCSRNAYNELWCTWDGPMVVVNRIVKAPFVFSFVHFLHFNESYRLHGVQFFLLLEFCESHFIVHRLLFCLHFSSFFPSCHFSCEVNICTSFQFQ